MAIGVSLQMLWNAWNIRSFLILSIFIQVILAYGSPFRRRTTRSFTIAVVWFAYLLADWTAIYVFGLISNTFRTSSVTPSEVNQDILPLWASFLLVHMGGPDTITAYALEDNALWSRHLLALLVKPFIFGYIFMKSFPSDLIVPTVFVLVTGVIKYGERTRALYLASLDNLKSSVTRRSIAALPEDKDYHGNYFYERFVGMIVDIMPSYEEVMESCEFFRNQDASTALKVISGELNLMYEALYTKILAVYSSGGIVSRCTFCIYMVLALVFFCLSKKAQVEAVDVGITFGLFVGAFLVDMSRGRMLLKSNWSAVTFPEMGCCSTLLAALFTLFDICSYLVSEIFLLNCLRYEDKLWSETMGSFNLLEYCFHKHKAAKSCGKFIDFTIQICGLAEKFDKMKYTKRNDLDKELWEFIFKKLRESVPLPDDEEKAKEFYESRGELVLRKGGCDELMRYVQPFEFDKGLLTWHIATEICYNVDQEGEDKNRKFSKIVSDYMMYLLIQRSKMMSPVAGIGHLRYSDTRDHMKNIVEESGTEELKEFCTKVLEEQTKAEPAHEKEGKSKSVLLDACGLAQALGNNSKKWEVILGVWVEMLSHAASHCRADAHARVLIEGGELITHVWLLLAHLGIGPRRPKEE